MLPPGATFSLNGTSNAFSWIMHYSILPSIGVSVSPWKMLKALGCSFSLQVRHSQAGMPWPLLGHYWELPNIPLSNHIQQKSRHDILSSTMGWAAYYKGAAALHRRGEQGRRVSKWYCLAASLCLKRALHLLCRSGDQYKGCIYSVFTTRVRLNSLICEHIP